MPYLQLRPTTRHRAASAIAALLLTGAVGPWPAPSAAADRTFRVDSLVDAVDAAVGDGACRTALGTCTLRAAVQEANLTPVPSQITLPPGRLTFSLASATPGVPNVNEPQAGDLDLLRPMTIRGAGARRTVIDTEGVDRAFSNAHLNVATLQDLAITGGRFGRTDSWSGGAVWNEGVMTLERVHLYDNEAGYGGAVFNTPRTHMVIRDSLLQGNRSGEGGAVRFDASGEVVNSTITGNSVFAVDQTRRPGELSGYGGGIDHRGGGDLLIVNSTITRNRALKGGGGINTSLAYAGGAAGPASPRTVRLYNTVVAGNTSEQGEQDCRAAGLPLVSLGHVLDGDGTCGTSGGTDLPRRDPRLSALRDHDGPTDTHLPHRRSPVVDSGGADGCPATDQRGVQRDSRCDIGAVGAVSRRALPLLLTAVLLGAVGAAGPVGPAAAERVLRVDATTDAVDADAADGLCRTALGTCTLRAAVMEANAVLGADTIEVPAGRYVMTIPAFPQRGQTQENDAGNGDLDLSDTVTIRGAGARQTIVDAAGTDRVFASQHRTTATLSDLTITGGRLDGSASGGGFWNLGFVTFDRVHLVDNEGAYGGAVFNSPLTHMVLRDSLVSGNRSGEGGGIRVDSSAEILNSTISGNQVVDGDQTRRPGEFYGYGGGIDHRGGGDVTIVHSTITANHALKGGGGLNSSQSYTPITESVAVGRVRIRSSIIAGNTSAEGPANCRTAAMVLLSAGHTLDSDGSCGTTGPTDVPGRDARLGPLTDNGGPTDTHRLLPDSPAVDGAAADGCPATDQRGAARAAGSACDIGAFELQDLRRQAPAGPSRPTVDSPSAVAPPPPSGGTSALPATGGALPGSAPAVAAAVLAGLWLQRSRRSVPA